MRLERLRDAVRRELNNLASISTLDDEIIDEAFTYSLTVLAPYYPEVRTELTVTTAGKTQDLALIEPTIAQINAVTYPYDPDYLEQPTSDYSFLDNHTVYFILAEPQVDETILTTFQAYHTILDLDGAETDTLPANTNHEHPLITMAVAHILQQLSWKYTITGDAQKLKAAPAITNLAKSLRDQAIEEAIGSSNLRRQNPAWPNIGMEN